VVCKPDVTPSAAVSKYRVPTYGSAAFARYYYVAAGIDHTRWNNNVQTGHGTSPACSKSALPPLPGSEENSGPECEADQSCLEPTSDNGSFTRQNSA